MAVFKPMNRNSSSTTNRNTTNETNVDSMENTNSTNQCQCHEQEEYSHASLLPEAWLVPSGPVHPCFYRPSSVRTRYRRGLVFREGSPHRVYRLPILHLPVPGDGGGRDDFRVPPEIHRDHRLRLLRVSPVIKRHSGSETRIHFLRPGIHPECLSERIAAHRPSVIPLHPVLRIV